MAEFEVIAFKLSVLLGVFPGCPWMQKDFSRAGQSSGRSRQLLLHSHTYPWPLICINDCPSFQHGSVHTDNASKQIHEQTPGKCPNLELFVFEVHSHSSLRTCFGVLVLEGATSEEQCEGGHTLFRLILTRSGFGFAKQKAKICLVQGPTLAVTSRKYQPLLIFLRQSWTRDHKKISCYVIVQLSTLSAVSLSCSLMPTICSQLLCYSWDL